MTRIADRIEAYVEAREEVLLLRRQKEADPTRLKDRVWLEHWNSAVSRAGEYQRVLTGGQLGKAERALREKGWVK